MTDLTITVVMVVSFSAGFLVRHILALRDVPVLDDEIRERHGSYELIRLGEAHWNRISPRRAWGIIGVLLCFLVLFAFASGLHAQTLQTGPLRLELGAGWTRYGTTDGIWYQSTYPHSNDLTGSSQLVGVSGPLAPEYQRLPGARLGWRLSYVHLGSFSNSAYWESDEAFYHPGTLPRCDVVSLSDCSSGDGSGNVWGASAGLTIEKDLGRLTLGAEAGSFLYYGKWTQTWRAPHNAATGVIPMTEMHLTPYAGVNVRLGYAFVMLRGYKGVHAGLADKVLRQVIVGVSIPLGGGK